MMTAFFFIHVYRATTDHTVFFHIEIRGKKAA